jgi:hypothetical protein
LEAADGVTSLRIGPPLVDIGVAKKNTKESLRRLQKKEAQQQWFCDAKICPQMSTNSTQKIFFA